MKELGTPIVIGIIIVIIIIAVILIYRSGKKSAEPPKVTYPHGGSEIPAGWSPNELVEELFNAMDGLFTLSGTKDAAWGKLANLPTNEMVRAVYDVYNQKYFSKGKGTLTQWIKDESYYDPTSGVKEAALQRLSKEDLI